ncbi:MAG: aminoacetone oxidase family FAD-binding enzyme [Bacillota bacterium]|nr:aminoacetone oxidase family FAD-binding enzyme [Bacillota bacterium]
MTQRQAKNKFPVIIIGGGASGLAAACVLSQNRTPFLLIEKERKLGRKLLATGNGRCNLMNAGAPVYFGDEAFAREALNACGAKEVGAFFESIGLAFFEEEQGRCYPLSRQAGSVLDALTGCINTFPEGCVLTETEALHINKTKAGFEVITNRGSFFAEKLLLAAGSPAAPKLGGTDSLIEVLRGLGHQSLPFSPALSALICKAKDIKGLSGLRVPCTLTLYADGKLKDAASGEALFTDYGVSGLCAMQLARAANEGLEQGRAVALGLDFSALLGLKVPEYRRLTLEEARPADKAAILKLLEKREKLLGKGRLYTGLLPFQMAVKLKAMSNNMAADWLGDLRLPVSGVKGFEQAQVASGGLLCAKFEPETMRSKLVPGLYAAGEILNVDGDTGGFNLLFAWACGILAAKDISKSLKD